jgi:non-heme chloroperoxidase
MGTGEVTRYLGRYGSARVAKGVLVSPIPPYLLQAGDNPTGCRKACSTDSPRPPGLIPRPG